MIIERAGEQYLIVEDVQRDEFIKEYTTVVHHRLSVRSVSGLFTHTSKGANRAVCLLGLLHQGFTIIRELGDPEEL